LNPRLSPLLYGIINPNFRGFGGLQTRNKTINAYNLRREKPTPGTFASINDLQILPMDLMFRKGIKGHGGVTFFIFLYLQRLSMNSVLVKITAVYAILVIILDGLLVSKFKFPVGVDLVVQKPIIHLFIHDP
jgi:hypothetical protein